MTQECQDLVCLVWSHNPPCVWSKVPSVYLNGPLCSGCWIGKWTKDANWPENLENAQMFSSACLSWWLSVAFIHRNHRLIRDGSLGQAPWLSHSSRTMKQHVLFSCSVNMCTKEVPLAQSMSPSGCPHVALTTFKWQILTYRTKELCLKLLHVWIYNIYSMAVDRAFDAS